MCKRNKMKIPKDYGTGIIFYGTKHEENPYERIKRNKSKGNKKKKG